MWHFDHTWENIVVDGVAQLWSATIMFLTETQIDQAVKYLLTFWSYLRKHCGWWRGATLVSHHHVPHRNTNRSSSKISIDVLTLCTDSAWRRHVGTWQKGPSINTKTRSCKIINIAVPFWHHHISLKYSQYTHKHVAHLLQSIHSLYFPSMCPMPHDHIVSDYDSTSLSRALLIVYAVSL